MLLTKIEQEKNQGDTLEWGNQKTTMPKEYAPNNNYIWALTSL